MSNQIYSSSKLYPKKYAQLELVATGTEIPLNIDTKAEFDTEKYNNIGTVLSGNVISFKEVGRFKVQYSIGVEMVNITGFGQGSFRAWIQVNSTMFAESWTQILTTVAGAKYTLSASAIIELKDGDELSIYTRRGFAANTNRQELNYLTIESVKG